MQNYLTWSLALVASAAIASPATAELLHAPQPGPVQLAQTTAATSTASPLLVQDDLPAGFQALPPTVANQLAAQFEALSGQLSQSGIEIETMAAFYKMTPLQVIGSSSSSIADPAAFDEYLSSLEDEATRDRLFAQVQSSIANVGPVEMQGYEYLTDLSNVADKSAGVSLDMRVLNQDLQANIALFRRGNTGVLAAIIHRPNESPELALESLVEMLESRLASQE